MHVIIIGAGTGGLCLAHGLRRAGISVAVYERDRTRTDGLQGYRVGISPDGSRALKTCLPPELFDTFVATCARAPVYFNMLTEQMDEVLSIPVGNDGDPVNSEKSVSRMTLRQVLLTGLEDIVHFTKTFTRYEQRADGTVTAIFEDGSRATGDVLVAADGANSRVRRQYLPEARQEETGIVSIGGKVPCTPETKALLSEKIVHGVTMIMAPKGYGAILHVMEFSPDRPRLLHDTTTDYIMWGFWASRDKFAVSPPEIPRPQLLPLASEMTASWHPNLRALIRQTDPSTLFSINIRTSVPVAPWPATAVTLLGDAIHTMTPGRGVGANTALRDAALLCRHLMSVRDGRAPLRQAIGEYEAEMREYGFAAVLESRKQMDGRSALHKPVVGRVMLAAMRSGMRFVNHMPPLKRRMADDQRRFRGADRSSPQSSSA